jgi:hypothetical protein
MQKAVTRLRHSKQLIRVTMIANATEEHFTFTLTSCDNRRAAGSGVAMRSGNRQTVTLQWNTSYHATHTNRGPEFSVGSAPRPTELSSASGVESSWVELSWVRVGSQLVHSEAAVRKATESEGVKPRTRSCGKYGIERYSSLRRHSTYCSEL